MTIAITLWPNDRWRHLVCRGVGLGLVAIVALATGAEARNARLVRDIDLQRGPHLPPPCPLSPCPIPEPYFGAVLSRLTPHGDLLLFSANDGASGPEPWVSDGSYEGTVRLGDLRPGAGGSAPIFIGSAGPQALLWAESTTSLGNDLWTTRGQPDDLERIALPCDPNCNPQTEGLILSAPVGDSLLFWVRDQYRQRQTLYRFDGNSRTVSVVHELCQAGGLCTRYSTGVQEWRGGLAYVEGDLFDRDAWFVEPGSWVPQPLVAGCSYVELLTASELGLLFTASCQGEPSGLYRLSEPTGTPLRLHGLTGDVAVEAVAGPDGFFLWSRSSDYSSSTIWWTDGSDLGTEFLATFDSVFDIAVLGNDLLLAARSGVSGPVTLWQVTRSGLRLELTTARVTTELVTVDDFAYFGAHDGVHGTELWSSDGSPQGTRLAADIYPGPGSSDPTDGGPGLSGFAVIGNDLFFAADHPAYDIELWTIPAGALPPALCVPAEGVLCLDERFQVTVDWTDHRGESGTGRALPLASDTGAFWFFDDGNLELMVKILDGCDSPWNSYWVFAGGLTDVAVQLEVEDRLTGVRRTYPNPLGQRFQPIQDTAAFSTCDATSE